ncbi:site-specific integrase [Acetobacter sp. LMG 32666]|uniref:tyrosine-type recombinase/integrase n=1 Tax=Acetobacter sp. LMG 32666 TaxID=2959295 RepID=UPI0030C81C87
MSLKIISRKDREYLYVRGTVCGKSIFESTGTADPKQAEAYRAKREHELWTASVFGARAVVTFSSAVEAYLKAEDRSDATKDYLMRLLLHFGRMKLSDITQETVDQSYRYLLRDGDNAAPATKVRGVLTPLKAVLEFAAVRQWCDRPAFKGPSIPKARSIFLRPDEASRLVESASPHIRPLLVFLICTGCRMSEAVELDWRDVDIRGARAVVWQKQGNERHIELVPRAISALVALPDRDGPVFRPRYRRGIGRGYADRGRASGGQIKSAWSVACRKAGLPGHMRIWTPRGAEKEKSTFVPDVTPHGLRHTWASWHYCLHRDVLALKEEGGWATMGIVARYAKKMPDAYRDEIRAWWGL